MDVRRSLVNVGNRSLETVPRQVVDRTGELVFNVLWSYVKDLVPKYQYVVHTKVGAATTKRYM
jgi:hypothetical protein